MPQLKMKLYIYIYMNKWERHRKYQEVRLGGAAGDPFVRGFRHQRLYKGVKYKMP